MDIRVKHRSNLYYILAEDMKNNLMAPKKADRLRALFAALLSNQNTK